MEGWSDGVMEGLRAGGSARLEGRELQYSDTPILQYSNTPILLAPGSWLLAPGSWLLGCFP
jgi:hypothetical protein